MVNVNVGHCCHVHFPRDILEGRSLHCKFPLVLNKVSVDHNMTHALWCIAVRWFYNKSRKLENTATINYVCTEPHRNEKCTCLGMDRWHKLPLRSIRIVSSNARLNKQSSFILRWRLAKHFFFLLTEMQPSQCSQSIWIWSNVFASAALIHLCHLFLVPVCRPLAAWHP